MERDVFLSLLALDSYNPGYGSSVGNLPESGKIGTAMVRAFKPGEQEGWQTAGFYGIAYDWNGETVISYRGTSFNDGFSEETLLDAATGWIVGAGLTGSLLEAIDGVLSWPLPIDPLDALGIKGASQARLAIDFYEDLQGDSVFEGVASTNDPAGAKPIVTTDTQSTRYAISFARARCALRAIPLRPLVSWKSPFRRLCGSPHGRFITSFMSGRSLAVPSRLWFSLST
jgi:hypothetical protein